DSPTFEKAQEVLERLAESSNRSVARRAGVALDGLGGPRRRYALAQLAQLGAIVKLVQPPGSPVVNLNAADSTRPVQIIPGKRWRGSDQGLGNIRRLGGQSRIDLYIVKGAPVSDEAVNDLQRDIPSLGVQQRGEAMLGVVFRSGSECQIGAVAPGTAAEKAG